MFYGFLAVFFAVAVLIGITKQGRKAVRVIASKDDGQPYLE
jgi:hypothetical protein